MGIGSILLGALKKVPWTSLAMNYGPELVKKFGERGRPKDTVDEEGENTFHLMEAKIHALETALEEQNILLAQQQDQLLALGTACSQLTSQVRMYRGISILATLVAVAFLIALLSR